MAWLAITGNPNWQYSDSPDLDKEANDTYNYTLSDHLNGIRTNTDGTQVYVLCRQVALNVSCPVGYGELRV